MLISVAVNADLLDKTQAVPIFLHDVSQNICGAHGWAVHHILALPFLWSLLNLDFDVNKITIRNMIAILDNLTAIEGIRTSLVNCEVLSHFVLNNPCRVVLEPVEYDDDSINRHD